MHDATASRKSTDRPSALPILALIVANIALAFGPWFVRLADVGPVAAGFWRLTLAVPLLFAGAIAGGWRPRTMPRAIWEIGSAHVCTPVTNAQLVCRLLLYQTR